MTLNQLQYFYSIAKHQNFRRAAEELYLSQSSLSQAMEKLEEELGVQLFRKEGRGIVLTEEGVLLQKDAKKVLDAMDDALQHQIKRREEKESSLYIGTTSHILNGYLPQVISGYVSSLPYPVKVEHSTLTSYPLESCLYNEKNDLIIGHLSETNDALTCVLFSRQSFVVIVPTQHPLAGRNSVSMKELAEEEWIVQTSASLMYPTIIKLMQIATPTPRIKQYINLTNVIYSVVGQGQGIAVVPNNPFFPHNNVSVLQIEDCSEHWDVQLAYLSERPLKKCAADFVRYVQDHPLIT